MFPNSPNRYGDEKILPLQEFPIILPKIKNYDPVLPQSPLSPTSSPWPRSSPSSSCRHEGECRAGLPLRGREERKEGERALVASAAVAGKSMQFHAHTHKQVADQEQKWSRRSSTTSSSAMPRALDSQPWTRSGSPCSITPAAGVAPRPGRSPVTCRPPARGCSPVAAAAAARPLPLSASYPSKRRFRRRLHRWVVPRGLLFRRGGSFGEERMGNDGARIFTHNTAHFANC